MWRGNFFLLLTSCVCNSAVAVFLISYIKVEYSCYNILIMSYVMLYYTVRCYCRMWFYCILESNVTLLRLITLHLILFIVTWHAGVHDMYYLNILRYVTLFCVLLKEMLCRIWSYVMLDYIFRLYFVFFFLSYCILLHYIVTLMCFILFDLLYLTYCYLMLLHHIIVMFCLI